MNTSGPVKTLLARCVCVCVAVEPLRSSSALHPGFPSRECEGLREKPASRPAGQDRTVVSPVLPLQIPPISPNWHRIQVWAACGVHRPFMPAEKDDMPGLFRYIAVFLILCLPAPGQAQGHENCTLQRLSQPDRHVLRCTGGLTITLDAAAQIGLLADPTRPPRVIELKSGSVLIDVQPGSAATQVQSRHAIAAVRGTEFAVEETETGSAVFVLTGRVRVSRRNAGFGYVTLQPGEGIDVAPGRRLEVKTWGQARVQELLSRFGR